jgi:hypothetical protein
MSHYLAYGFVVGDAVESLIDYEDWLVKGKKGKVVGASESIGEDSEERVLVKFVCGTSVNVLAKTHIKKATLAGGFVVGDAVESLVERNQPDAERSNEKGGRENVRLLKGRRGKVVREASSRGAYLPLCIHYVFTFTYMATHTHIYIYIYICLYLILSPTWKSW